MQAAFDLPIANIVSSIPIMPGGWGAGVADWYARRADVVNRGFSGYNTRWLRQHKDAVAASLPTWLVVRRRGWPFWAVVLVAAPFYGLLRFGIAALTAVGS